MTKPFHLKPLTLSTLAVVCALLSPLAYAEPEVLVLDPAGDQMRASGAQVDGFYRTIPRELRALSLKEAGQLLKSTESPAWEVKAVKAPVCTLDELNKLKRAGSKKKSEVKQCLQDKADCEAADKLAHKFGLHAACSPLYQQTTVLLSTKDGGAK